MIYYLPRGLGVAYWLTVIFTFLLPFLWLFFDNFVGLFFIISWHFSGLFFTIFDNFLTLLWPFTDNFSNRFLPILCTIFTPRAESPEGYYYHGCGRAGVCVRDVSCIALFRSIFSYDPEIFHLCSPPYAASLINFWCRAGARGWARSHAHAFSVVMHFFVKFFSFDSEISN